MHKRVISSTSKSSATCPDILLRQSDRVRLIFRPELVKNPHDEAACVHGIFIYQRKGINEEWDDGVAFSLSNVKKGQGIKLELHAAEVLALHEELKALYSLYAKDGIKRGKVEYIAVDSAIASLRSLPPDEVKAYLEANRTLGTELLTDLLTWTLALESPSTLVQRLVSLGPAVLKSLNVAVGIESLRRALAIWDENSENSDEEFWQRALIEHSFVLEHVFSWPATIVKGKAYVGGKSVLDSGGNIVDFLVKNYMTNNAALVEIKTPTTQLLSRRYRSGVYNVSEHLGGAVMQVLNYRFTLQRDFYSLEHGIPGGMESFEPRAVVIIGSTDELQADSDTLRAFELYRNSLPSVSIITFDELFQKTRHLVKMLETQAG